MEKNVSYSFEESGRFKATNMTSQSINGTKSLPILIRTMRLMSKNIWHTDW